MFTKIKGWCKSPLFIEAVMGGALLLMAIVALVVVLLGTDPKPQPAPPVQTTLATEPVTPPAGPSVLGIDVSEHQSQIDWQQVKAAGVEFVMIRVGWQGYTKGELFPDTLAQSHYAGARAAGLKVGAYVFSQAITPEEGAGNASFLLQQIEGWQIDMPLAINWEHMGDENRTTQVDARMLTDVSKAFCETIARAGHQPLIYFNADLGLGRMHLEELSAYPFWFAQYSQQLNFPHPVRMWQYTCTGKVPGIAGDVDMDRYFP